MAYENNSENGESLSERYAERIRLDHAAGRLTNAEARALYGTAPEVRHRKEPGELAGEARGQDATSVVGDESSQLRAQQARDLFSDYAATLPAAAKVSQPALNRQVQKEVPALAENDGALRQLLALPNKAPSGRPLAESEGKNDCA